MSTVTALSKKRRWYYKNTAIILTQQSSFKVLFILFFVVFFEGGLFWLFIDGFFFLDSFGGMGSMIINRLFSLFFLGMGMMLVLSSVVTTYSTVFRSDEIKYLLSKPFTMGEISVYKFLESTRLSSWAFFFIIVPFVGSYAWHLRMSPMFVVWTLLFSLPFLILCSGVGSIITFSAIRWFPRGKVLKAILFLIGSACVLGVFSLLREVGEVGQTATFKIARLVPGLRLASNPLIPSWWVSQGIMDVSRGNWLRGIMLMGLTVSSAFLFLFFIAFLGRKILYDCWQMQVSQQGGLKRLPVMFRGLSRIIRFLPCDIRGIALKDIRTFCRDPLQWSQALVFFGLLGIYFANLKTLNYQAMLPTQWLNTISFINVFSVSAVMTSLGSRFVYPQLSMEGQGFWLLGLSPTSMTRIIMTKFCMSLIGMLTISSALISLSTHMMNSELSVRLVALALAWAISFAISAFSTGLGAIFLDLEERNPAAIVSGFGGTLNLVLSLGFMLAVIAPFAVIFHANSLYNFPAVQFTRYIYICAGWLAGLTLVSTVAPLALGTRSLKNRDF